MIDEVGLGDAEDNGHASFSTALQNLLWAEAKRREGLAPHDHPHGLNALQPDSPAARRLHLRHLEVAAECDLVAEQVMADVAGRAGRAGASYPEMGSAARITRQAARNRWPMAVGTRWYLHTLTGRKDPHGVGVALLRSRDKAVSTGWEAVRKGDAASGGVVAAVVCNSERRVVWGCLFDFVQYDAVTTDLPADLVEVPDAGEAHTKWVSQWALFVNSEIKRRTARS
ncbi:hypothetical protein [Streptomyces clavifer]|uniref:hypothetical protein n=1 Tax=Streptomyces clavifer TaxID=68188 RepID=UPI0033F7EAD6